MKATKPAATLPKAPSPTPAPVENFGDDELRRIALDKITPSPHNPRKTFDASALGQLAESILSKGVLEPVILRPRKLRVAPGGTGGRKGFVIEIIDDRGQPVGILFEPDSFRKTEAECQALLPRYELVAGERRWRAATLAGLAVIPALVRNLSDKAAAEVAVIENDQREDIAPLEQAEGYRYLIELGDDVAAIAAKIGRPEKYVAARLQLVHLVDELKEELRSGKLPFGHAHLLARLRADDQQALLKHGRLYDYSGQPIPIQKFRRRVRESFLNCLSSAPWKWDDAELLPEAGACTTCPRRSGSNPTLFDELLNGEAKKGSDYCTDLTCFAAKREAFVQLQLKTTAAKAGGVEPLRVSADFCVPDRDKGVVLNASQYQILDRKELKTVPADEVKTAVIVTDRHGDQVGKVVKVRVAKPAANKEPDNSFEREQAARQRKAEANKAAALKANGIVAAKVRAVAGNPNAGRDAVTMFRALAAAVTNCGGADACRLVAKRRGLTEKAKRDDPARGPVRALAAELCTTGDLVELIAEVIAAHTSNTWKFSFDSGMGSQEKEFWAAFGVDRSKLVKEAEKERAEKKAEKKARRAKAGAK
mgnify:CR=1 FL=1